ncbi:UNVERIFIED_CONTAM: putative ribonuclease H protein [Sesamum angustifolium]|uniref:Ribonuclease H protein n=1 Tax=Sesamum angustifolium TaxID=2727405 RepID=A0AAW2JK59_9LAMI
MDEATTDLSRPSLARHLGHDQAHCLSKNKGDSTKQTTLSFKDTNQSKGKETDLVDLLNKDDVVSNKRKKVSFIEDNNSISGNDDLSQQVPLHEAQNVENNADMPLYIMQVLSPPILVIQKLEQLLAKYFWGTIDSKKMIHWTRWANVYYPTKERGLGIRNFRDTVEAFSYKLWWRLRLNDSLWALFTMNKSNIWKPEHLRGDIFASRLLKLKIPETRNYQKSKTVYWLKPDLGWLKLNTGGASKGNPGLARAGGIVKDYEGKVIFVFSEPIGFTNNMVAEMHAVLRGLSICLEKGFSKVWLELDALHVIYLIFRQIRGAWYIQNMLQHIQIYLTQMKVRISHIFREGNQAADYFANQALEVDEISIVNHDQLQGRITGIAYYILYLLS